MPLQRVLPTPARTLNDLDARLVADVRRGDPAALAELYRAHSPALFALARHLLGSRADAEDVLHDVFVGLPDALKRYEERGRLAAWLKRVTARVALNRLRSAERRREATLDDVHQSRATGLDSLMLADAVAALPDGLRAVFVLKEVQGFSHAEIAALLEITRGTSEVRLHRAVRLLRTLLDGER